jgi:hypothetical protein
VNSASLSIDSTRDRFCPDAAVSKQKDAVIGKANSATAAMMRVTGERDVEHP